jgi:hypothetical protein
MQNRSIRIFLSSTFRDFGEERDLLVSKVFPNLRAKLKDRFASVLVHHASSIRMDCALFDLSY